MAPNSKWRRFIVPAPEKASPACSGTAGKESGGEEVALAAARRLSWAELMLRVFKTDVLVCPRCSGRMTIIATVTYPSTVRAILDCLGLAARPPPLSPAQEREQGEFEFGG